MLRITKRKQEPPLPSPKKKNKKSHLHEDEGELDATQVDMFEDDDSDVMGATQVDWNDGDEKDGGPVIAYKLTAFGEDDILNIIDEKTISCEWSDEPYCIGRIKFLKLPDEHKNRISRKHFEIHCCLNEKTGAIEYWLVDFSANGTMVDGEVGHTGKKTLLSHGSTIGVLLTVAKDHILFGYSFSIEDNSFFSGRKDKDNNKPLKGVGKIKLTEKAKPTITSTTTSKDGKSTLKSATNGKDKVGNGNGHKPDGVFAVPAPKARGNTTTSSNGAKAKSGFMHGVRYALVGYDDTALSDPKKKRLIQDLKDVGATYVENPEPSTVDIVILNRNYFKEPNKYEVDLPSLTSTLRVRFLSNTRWLEDCVREGRKVELKNEILPANSGGVIVLDPQKDTPATKAGIDPKVVRQLASMLREEKKLGGARWKLIAPLASLQACEGALEGLEASVEVLKKGTTSKGDEDMGFMLGIREAYAAGYRHTLLLVNTKDKENPGAGLKKIEHVVSVVDVAGLTAFSQALHSQRKSDNEKTKV